MSQIEKRTIEELSARYQLEPELDDVFVEGAFDKDVLSSCQDKLLQSRAIYEIDTVNVSEKILKAHSLTSGNKQRVIALARELVSLGGSARLTCLVDRDLDHWFGSPEATSCLRWTLYCSIDLHFFTQEIVSSVVITSGKARIGDVSVFFSSLVSVLRELYIMRLADRALELSLRWVELRKYLVRKGDKISFRGGDYVVSLLSSNKKNSRKAEFSSSCEEFSSRLSGDCRLHVRGHDFVYLLAWVMKEFGGHKELASEVAIERMLVLLSR
jgi:hypothetical protein